MEWLSDDELQATLATVHAWWQDDGENDRVATVTDGIAMPTAGCEVAARERSRSRQLLKQTRSINASREKRKEEIAQVKTEYAKLVDRLHALQEQRHRVMRAHVDGRSGSLLTTAPLWERLARRQIAARMKAEAENERLKRLITSQAQAMEEVSLRLKQAHYERQTAWLQQLEAVPMCGTRLALEAEEQTMRHLQSLEALWRVVFGRRRFASCSKDSFDARVFHSRTHAREIVHELHASLLLPHSVSRAHEAAWAMCQEQLRVGESKLYKQEHETRDDVLLATFVETRLKGDRNGTVSGKFAVKRFWHGAEGGFVAHSRSEPTGILPELDGSQIDETSWVRVLRPGDLALGDVAVACVQFVRRTRITISMDHPLLLPSFMNTVTQFVADDIRRDMENLRDALDSALLRVSV